MKRVTVFVIGLAFAIGIAELTLRFLGFLPFSLPSYSFNSEPSWCFGKDSLGLVLQPGRFLVNNNGVKYTATHSENLTRITSSRGLDAKDSLSTVFVFGCSYTYGQGVNDELTYPYLLQVARPDLSVKNFAVPGYGIIQAYLKLKEQIDQGNIPDYVVVNYAHFHEERDALLPSYQYKLFQGFQLVKPDYEALIYPKVHLLQDSFVVESVDVLESFRPIIGRSYSALLNLVETTLVNYNSSSQSTLSVSKVLVNSIFNLCKSYNIHFLLTDVERSVASEPMVEFCAELEIPYLNISPEDFSSKFRVSEYDRHPNSYAHQVYAEHVNQYLLSLTNK